MENQQQEQAISRGDLKKVRVQKAMRKVRIVRLLVIIGIIGGIFLFIGIGTWAVRRNNKTIPGEMPALQGQDHVGLDYEFGYNSNPPTSGPHYPDPANWGIYDYKVNDKFFIHNMEHGGIWISYRPNISSKAIDDLKAIVEEFDGSQIVMGPRAANDADVAVAAWTHLYKFNLTVDGLSDQQKGDIRTFYRKLKNHGPEFVPGMQGVNPKTIQDTVKK